MKNIILTNDSNGQLNSFFLLCSWFFFSLCFNKLFDWSYWLPSLLLFLLFFSLTLSLSLLLLSHFLTPTQQNWSTRITCGSVAFLHIFVYSRVFISQPSETKIPSLFFCIDMSSAKKFILDDNAFAHLETFVNSIEEKLAAMGGFYEKFHELISLVSQTHGNVFQELTTIKILLNQTKVEQKQEKNQRSPEHE